MRKAISEDPEDKALEEYRVLAARMTAFVTQFGLGRLHTNKLDAEGCSWLVATYKGAFHHAQYIRSLVKPAAWLAYETTFKGTQFAEVTAWRNALAELKAVWATRPKSVRRSHHGSKKAKQESNGGDDRGSDQDCEDRVHTQ